MLSLCANHSANNALERAKGDDDLVATFEVALFGRNKENVGVVDVAEANEVTHLAVGDGERRVFAVWSHGKVIVIIAYAGDAKAMDCLVKNRGRGMDEDDVGYQGLGDFLALAVNHSDLVVEWEENLETIALEPFAGFPFAIVGNTEDIPARRFVEAILYRHPSGGLAGDGAQWWLSTYSRVVALPVVHINQRVRV